MDEIGGGMATGENKLEGPSHSLWFRLAPLSLGVSVPLGAVGAVPGDCHLVDQPAGILRVLLRRHRQGKGSGWAWCMGEVEEV